MRVAALLSFSLMFTSLNKLKCKVTLLPREHRSVRKKTDSSGLTIIPLNGIKANAYTSMFFFRFYKRVAFS